MNADHFQKGHAGDAKSRDRGPRKGAPDLRIVAVESRPTTDAPERMRRLFALLFRVATSEADAAPASDPFPAPPLKRNPRDLFSLLVIQFVTIYLLMKGGPPWLFD